MKEGKKECHVKEDIGGRRCSEEREKKWVWEEAFSPDWMDSSFIFR